MDRHHLQRNSTSRLADRVWLIASMVRNLRGILVLLVMLSIVAGSLSAQPPLDPPPLPEESLAAKLHRRGDLTLRDASLTEALFSISETWKVNVVVGEVEGRVNGVFSQATLSDILDAILLTNGYSYRPVGQSLVIMKLEELGDSNPLFDTAIVTLEHAKPVDILNAVQVLASPRGKVHAIESTNSILIVDFPEKVSTIRDRSLDLDEATAKAANGQADATRLNVAYFTPQYVKVDTVKDALSNLLSEHGKLATIALENRIVVTDYDYKLRQIERAIQQLDCPRPQVRISALIYDIGLEDMERLGINWGHDVQGGGTGAAGLPNQMWAIDAVTTVAPPVGAVNGAMTFLSMNQHFNLRAVVNALQEAGDSRLLADPNVTVIDNEVATMAVVREIPYQQLTQTGEGGNIGTTAFREAGIKLEVKPHIAADGTIAMDVMPSFSRLVGFTDNDNQPIIDRREAKTRVRVANGRTLVIGGLRQRQDLGDFAGIPFLKDVKGVGAIFRSRQTNVTETELVVFITPVIVPSDHGGRPRELAAFDTGQCWLDRIPIARGCPPPACNTGCGIKKRCKNRAPFPEFPRDDSMGPQMITPGVDQATRPGQATIAAAPRQPAVNPRWPTRLPSARVAEHVMPRGNLPTALPQPDGERPRADVAKTKSSVLNSDPLRSNYAVRFRDAEESRTVTSKPEEPAAETAQRKPNMFERIFRY